MTTIGAALLGGAWLWDKFGTKVVERASRLMGDAGRHAYEQIDWQGAAERYRQEMQMLYGTMRIIGMAEPVALADIFTDVYLLDKPRAWRRYNIEELKQQSRPENEGTSREQRRNALDLVRKHERLLILGKPGAGKTTLLKHLVLQCTTGKLDAVPIFVGLKAWSDSRLELMPFLAQQFAICAFPNAQPFIEHILLEGRALVEFDGLDEVSLEQGARERIIHTVRDLANQYPRSRFMITCRIAASDYQFERFTYCELADFSAEQMSTFAAQWFQRYEAKREAFLAEFAKPEHDRLRDLARTPLLLTLLCLTFDETMTFPLRRAEIYEEALDALLKKWDASRSIKRDTIYRQLSLGHKRQMLARIAAETFGNNELFMRQNDLEERIGAYLRRLPATDVTEEFNGEAILRSIEAQHGLLVERAQRIYSFSHLTFHEYFTARYTAEHPSRQMFDSMVRHAHDSRWREVLLLTASILDDTNAEIFFESFDAALRAMIQGGQVLPLLFQWIQRKAKHNVAAHQSAARRSYLGLALITIAVSCLLETRTHAVGPDRDLDRALDRARAFALELDLLHARELVSALAHVSTRDRELVSALPHVNTRDRGLDRALALALARDLARTHAPISDAQRPMMQIFQKDRIWAGVLLWAQVLATSHSDDASDSNYDELLDIWHRQNNDASPALRTALTMLVFPEKDGFVEDWQKLAIDLHAALATHLDIGHVWILVPAQLECLADYLAASACMLECLDLAAVADRDAIRNRLLLPPQP